MPWACGHIPMAGAWQQLPYFFKECLNLTSPLKSFDREYGMPWQEKHRKRSFSLVWAMFGWYIAVAMALSEALSRMRGDFFLKNLVANQSTAVLMMSLVA